MALLDWLIVGLGIIGTACHGYIYWKAANKVLEDK
jgi:hypothetical protein